MRRFLGVLSGLVKAVAVVAAGSVMRIIKHEGEGVFETAMQNAVREIAINYLRSVSLP
jgi:hypothetical protein